MEIEKGCFYIVTYIFNLMVCSFSPRTLLSTLESQFHLHAHTDIPGQWFTFLLQITLSYLQMEIYLLLSCSEMMVAELMLGDLTQFLPNLHWANKKTIKRDKISIEHMRKQVKQKGHFKNPFNSSSCSGHWENGGKMLCQRNFLSHFIWSEHLKATNFNMKMT